MFANFMARGASLLAGNRPYEAKDTLDKGLKAVVVIVVSYFLMKLAGAPVTFSLRLFDVPVSFSVLTVLILVMFWVDSSLYIRKHQMGIGDAGYATASVIAMLAVVGSVAVHEIAHAVVSFAVGNPIENAGITWWGGFVSPAKSFDEILPMQQVLIALAGPLVNALIAIVAIIIVAWRNESLAENTVQYVGVINIRFFRFNLIPLFILDGGKVFDGLLRLISQDDLFRSITLYVAFVATIIAYKAYRKTHVPLEDLLAEM